MTPRPSRRRPIHRPLRRRLRAGAGIGLRVGALYALIAFVMGVLPNNRGFEPSLLDTLAPVAGGVLTGLLTGLLWPAGARRTTAILAGIIAGIPFGLAVIISIAGSGSLGRGVVIPGAMLGIVIGIVNGAFMYDHDR